MDNISHTLIGALVGEALESQAGRSKSSLPPATRRNLLVGTMAVGSNFPDLDFLYPEITGLKLDYLLHHRGHTHTVVGAVVIALLLFVACTAWLRYRKLEVSSHDRLWLGGAALLGPLLHIAMDFTNSYGVHPFWPFWNGWLYGDSVFIVEPLLWAAAAPLLFTMRSPVTRALIALILIAGVALSFSTGLVPTVFALALVLVTGVLLVIGRYGAPRTAVFAGLGTWLVATTMFAISGRVAAHEIRIAARGSQFGAVLDHALTPMPVNPVCWEVILVQATQEQYALRRAVLSLAPGWIEADACPFRTPPENITAPLRPSSVASNAAVRWRGELVLSRAELRRLAAEHCEVSNLMGFARAPFFVENDGVEAAGDLRFDREPGLSFAEVQVGKDGCSSFVPRLIPPREDLLRHESGRDRQSGS